MSTNHILYINIFENYKPTAFGANIHFSRLSHYSTFIHNKANEIFSIAANHVLVDSPLLCKEITALGITDVKLFVAMTDQKINI